MHVNRAFWMPIIFLRHADQRLHFGKELFDDSQFIQPAQAD
jgi:hypothetical protein